MMVDTLYKLFNMSVKNSSDGGPATSKGTGVPQGNPLSSTLVNVYLNELDQFMDCLKKDVNKGTFQEWAKATRVEAFELSKAKTRKVRSSF